MMPRNRRDHLLTLASQRRASAPGGYVPAAFFLHFGADAAVGPSAIAKHRDFFRFTGMDFVKIQYEQSFPPQPVARPQDWKQVQRQDEAFFAPMLEVVRGLVEELKAEAPVVVTLYSPFMCAGQVAAQHGGSARVTAHLEEDPDAVAAGLGIVTENLKTFVDACIHLGVDGFYHSTQGGESRRFRDRRLFTEYVKPHDLAIMRHIERHCPFNILHICDYHRAEVGGYDDLTPFLDYPGHIVNCALDIDDRRWTGAEISELFQRPFLGGMDRLGPLAQGTPEDAREAARQALQSLEQGNSRPYLLGADCTVPGNTPWENLRAAIEVAHGASDQARDRSNC